MSGALGGARWELVTEHAAWNPRPDSRFRSWKHHGLHRWPRLALAGQSGAPPGPDNPFLPGHPNDQWSSRDGKTWTQLPGTPWNAASSADVKYDFHSLVVRTGPCGLHQSLYTFGGDGDLFVNPVAKQWTTTSGGPRLAAGTVRASVSLCRRQ